MPNTITPQKTSKTKWFIEHSKSYMKGCNPSLYQWVRAYARFMWFMRKEQL